jgi:integrase
MRAVYEESSHSVRDRKIRDELGGDDSLRFWRTALFARNLYRSFKELLKRGDLPDIRFHDLRHTAATLLLTAGVNPKVVSEMLGHSTVAITLDIYTHVIPDMQQDAASAMGNPMSS